MSVDDITKRILGGKVYFIIHFTLHHSENSGPKPTAGTEEVVLPPGKNTAMGKKKNMRLAPHGLFILLSYHIPRGGTAHRELGSPTAIISYENAPAHTDLRTGQSEGTVFSVEVPLPR